MGDHVTFHNPVEFHDQLASSWEAKYKKRSFRNRIRAFEALGRDIEFEHPGHWLDAGCGSGLFSRWLAGKGCQVTGVDASREMIQCAQRLADHEFRSGSPIRFNVVDDILKLDFPERSFAGILCLSVLEYLERPADAVREFHRLLEPDGYLVLSVPNRRAVFRMLERWLASASGSAATSRKQYLEYSRHWYSKREIGDLLEAAGFHYSKFRYAGMPLPVLLDNTMLTGSLIFVLARKR